LRLAGWFGLSRWFGHVDFLRLRGNAKNAGGFRPKPLFRGVGKRQDGQRRRATAFPTAWLSFRDVSLREFVCNFSRSVF
jgi:hypothetical protein